MIIPRINEVTIVWDFQGPQDFRQINLTLPKVFVRTLSKERIVLLKTIKAVLTGSMGEMFFEFDISQINADGDLYEITNPLRKELSLIFSEIFTGSSFESVGYGPGQIWLISMKFTALPGESFTTTTGKRFLQLMSKLTEVAEIIFPVPVVTSRTFFQIGHLKVSFDMAFALDLYMENAFQAIRRTYKRQGAKSAARHYHRVVRAYMGSDYFDIHRPKYEGCVILLGKREIFYDYNIRGFDRITLYEYCVGWSMDGYEMSSAKFGHLYRHESLANEAKEIAEVMGLYGIKTYKILHGKRSRSATKIWVRCDYLDQKELEIFQAELTKVGIEEEGKVTARSSQ